MTKQLVYVATDGHRLAISKEQVNVNYARSTDSTLGLLQQAQPFYCEHGAYTSVVPELEYPDVKQVIPKSQEFELIISLRVGTLIDVCKMLKTIKSRYYTTSKRYEPCLVIDPTLQQVRTSGSSEIQLSTTFAAAGITHEAGFDGKPFGLNALYLLDVLTTLKKAGKWTATLQYTTPLGAVTLTTANDDYEKHVIIPMRLS